MRLISAIIMTSLVLAGCKIVTTPTDPDSGVTVTVADLRIRDEISPWSESGEGFKVYIGEELSGPINGAAYEYLNLGLQETGLQEMTGNDLENVTIYVMDFGTPEKAAFMFAEKARAISSSQQLGQFAAETAVIDASTPIGCTAYGHFANLYFELAFAGFQDKTQSYQVANLFMKTYQSKIR